MNLCLSHHITNESLAALFVTGALYFCLRLLRTETGAGNLAIATGACMGLALLTKFSAVLVVPLILVALAWNLLKSKVPSPESTVVWRRTGGHLALVVAACLAVCGWHFARVWHRFGTPLIGNWDPRLPFAWWQDPGYHTGEWYRSFGQAFVTPLFSSISGFADGVYATFWGDGLCSGSAMMNFRPQWNYDLMNAGYLLSLLGTALLIAGICVALIRFIRQPTPEWFLLLGLVFAFAVGVALMSLRVASYAQVKAFYALPALLPLCAMAALGWDFLSGKSATLRLGLQVGVLAWATTVYLAFWIRPANAFTHTVRGVGFADDGRFAEAAESFTRALTLDPQALTARVGLAEAWRHLGRGEEARQQADLALQQHPREAEALMESAAMLGLERRYDDAVRHSMQAISEAPDHPGAYQQLAACLALAGQQRQVVETCEKGLRVTPFNPTLHHSLAVAAVETGDLTNAMTHLRLALALKPRWPEARSFLALTLDSIGRHEEAAAEYEQAIKDKPDDARLRYLYAMTLAMQGKAIEAAGHYRQVLDLQPDHVEAMNNLAWILAANPDAQARNGGEAVRLAERACELTRQREPVLLGTLAAAYAEAGRFPDAAAAAEKARVLATAAGQKEVADKNSELLELYRVGKPYREGKQTSSNQ
jgi:Flp pilus assembly protein TadD